MAGFTDAPFRLLCREQGCDHTVTEMVSAKGLLYGSGRTATLLFTLPAEGPVSMQLFGREPAVLAEAARRIEGEHGDALAAIDLNFGCPAPKITGNGEGSALMREPALCGRIVAAVAAAVRVPVTVKLRKGFDAAHNNAVEVARICEEAGAAMITVHGRTREQRYAGQADWDCVAAVAAQVRVPVVGNGDVASGTDALLSLIHISEPTRPPERLRRRNGRARRAWQPVDLRRDSRGAHGSGVYAAGRGGAHGACIAARAHDGRDEGGARRDRAAQASGAVCRRAAGGGGAARAAANGAHARADRANTA